MKRQGTGSNPPRKGMADGASPSCFYLPHFQPISLWRGVGRKTRKAFGRDRRSSGRRHLPAPLSPTDMRKTPPLSGADQPPWGECVPLQLDCWGLICAHHWFGRCSSLGWEQGLQPGQAGHQDHIPRSSRTERRHQGKVSFATNSNSLSTSVLQKVERATGETLGPYFPSVHPESAPGLLLGVQ